ncbi:MAG: hypothetical protein OXH39_13610 [Candidatus Poribacteria bacterium]|nr:hypothetical protein [Candidatus Poribacteria bacterium]
MKDLRDPTTSSTTEDKDDESKANTSSSQNVDVETIENNPKIDAQLVLDFYRLVEASQGVIRSGRGANYSLSHPLDSKVVPTDDPNQTEEDMKKVKKK